jgi:hypothetical protein
LSFFIFDAHHPSVRKRQRQAPRFYFFDNGVIRALARMLTVKPKAGKNDFSDFLSSS